MIIDPQTYNLSTLYDELNRDIFLSELDVHPITWAKKISKQFVGITRCSIRVPPNTPKWRMYDVATVTPGSITITICPYRFPLDQLKGIVAHEMIHALNFQTNQLERNSHGLIFSRRWKAAQQRAPFTIPHIHTNVRDISMAGNQTAPQISFIVYYTNNKFHLSFYPKYFFTSPSRVERVTEHLQRALARKSIEWYVIGTAVSLATLNRTIQRTFKGRGYTFPSLSSTELDHISVLRQEGPVPTPLITQTP